LSFVVVDDDVVSVVGIGIAFVIVSAIVAVSVAAVACFCFVFALVGKRTQSLTTHVVYP